MFYSLVYIHVCSLCGFSNSNFLCSSNVETLDIVFVPFLFFRFPCFPLLVVSASLFFHAAGANLIFVIPADAVVPGTTSSSNA